MTLQPELMHAILSMDAYNRGYDASIILSGTQIGSANITTDSQILGTAVVDGQTVDKHETTGFYALAYNYDGQTIISYRGTDYPEEGQTTDVPLVGDVPNDIYHGWTLGDGNLASEQGQMAIDFYNQVAN